MKICVSAYACEPEKGSEQEVGWRFVNEISKYHETWVITRSNNRDNLENTDSYRNNTNLNFKYIDLPERLRFWKKWPGGVQVYYTMWQYLAAKKSIDFHKEIDFDLAHHLTFISGWTGPGISVLPIPFIWGPIGTNPEIPKEFQSIVSNQELIKGKTRELMMKSGRYRDPFLMLGLRKANRLLLTSKSAQKYFPGFCHEKMEYLYQNAIDESEIVRESKQLSGTINIITVARLIDIKGYELAIRAFKKFHDTHPDSQYTIVGDGHLRATLSNLVNQLGISNCVTFTGQTSRSKAIEHLEKADIFLFPTFEGAGMVTLEAMSKGLPVIALDFGGPAEYIDSDCGFLIKPEGIETSINQMAESIEVLSKNKELYGKLSENSIERIKKKHTWEARGKHLMEIYESVMKEAK